MSNNSELSLEEKDSPVTRDIIDKKHSILFPKQALAEAITAVFLANISPEALRVPMTTFAASNILIAINFLYNKLESMNVLPSINLERITHPHRTRNPNLEWLDEPSPEDPYTVVRQVYRGKKPLEIGNKIFKEGENYLFIQFPSFERIDEIGELTEENISNILSFLDERIESIKQDTKEATYGFVALRMNDNLRQSSKLEQKKVFDANDTILKKRRVRFKSEPKILLFTREEFEALNISNGVTFKKAVEALADQELNEITSLIKQIENKDQEARLKRILQKCLDQILLAEMQPFIDMEPSVSIDHITQERSRQKGQRSLSIRKLPDQYQVVVTTMPSGEVSVRSLDRILDLPQPVEAILISDSKFKKAQLAYLISKIISESSLTELDNNNATKKLKEDYEAKRIDAKKPTYPKVEETRKSSFIHLRNSILLTLTLSGVADIGNIIDSLKSSLLNRSTESTPLTLKEHQPNFPDEVPQHQPEWKISGTLSPDGYYFTNTSSDFENGMWQINKNTKEILSVPASFDSSAEPFLQLSRTFILNQFGQTEFKLPIKQNTRLAALSLTDSNHQEIEADIIGLNDGTIQINIPTQLVNSSAVVNVEAYFTSSLDNQVVATESVEPINIAELSPELQSDLNEANSQADPTVNLFYQVSGSHLYSIDPPNKESILTADAEDFINAADNLSGLSCDIANSEAILLNSVVENGRTINMAYGYIAANTLAGSAGSGGFLQSDTLHAFGVDDHGEIMDATPNTPANDLLTQSYIQQLHTPYSGSGTDVWEYTEQQIIQSAIEHKQKADTTKNILGALAASLSTVALFQFSKFYRRNEDELKTKVELSKDTAISNFFTKKELVKAFSLVMWISYRQQGSLLDIDMHNEAENLSKTQIIKRIRTECRLSEIIDFISSPDSFYAQSENKFNKIFKTKMNLLLRYALAEAK